jgi:SHS2 domain-containing protein
VNSRGFEEIEHTADIAIRVRGRSLAEMFASAAYGMACQMAGQPASTDAAGKTTERTIELTAYDAETLLVTWLGELLYLSEREGCVFTEFDMVQVTASRLRAVVRGGPAAAHRRHIKAVTFNDLDIVHTDAGYETTIVFDV